jgi:hypothetical protein
VARGNFSRFGRRSTTKTRAAPRPRPQEPS